MSVPEELLEALGMSHKPFEHAMLTARPGDGEFFAPWVRLWVSGRTTEMLRLEDPEWNLGVLERGSRNPPSWAPMPLPAWFSPALAAYARTVW